MKKYLDIIEEIKKARASIKDTAKTEKELDFLALKEAHKNGSPEEQAEARAKYKKAEARYIEECIHNEDVQIKLEILKDNAKQALLSETIGTICNIWNKYESKPHGEKTREKIQIEIKNTIGHRVYIGNRWGEAHIAIYIDHDTPGAALNCIEIMPEWNGGKQPALDNNNKIVKLTAENMRVYCCGDFVENVNEHTKAIREAHAAAKEAEKIFGIAVDNYNKLTRGNIQHANAREGVKNWII